MTIPIQPMGAGRPGAGQPQRSGQQPSQGQPASEARLSPEVTMFDAIGGMDTFRTLVDRFYDGVWQDPILKPMYPEDDFEGAKDRLRMFLVQYWGGPKDYGEQRGHPRLRMRHAPFPVSPAARDAWLHHMRAAVESLELAPIHENVMLDYLDRAAHSMVNTHDGGEAPMAGQTMPDHMH